MPPQGEGPSLPAEFVVPLKQLSGRAREIMANRMALSMNYFALADRPWLESFVLAPMLSESKESLRLWEALGKFGRVPTPDLWATLELEFYRRLSSAGLSPEARRQLAEMCVIVWVRSKQSGTLYGVKSASLRSALGLASEDVRADVAWRFWTIFSPKNKDEHEANLDWWSLVGQAFFAEVWPLEPVLQSAASANHFARVPARVGLTRHADAVSTVHPFLRPFQVWAVYSEFWLDPKSEVSAEIVRRYPEETLILLSACISENQKNQVMDLRPIIDWIANAEPSLKADVRLRRLGRLAAD
jgi:hypothetical protein